MAKCECGREMLKANGCRFKRIVVHGKSTKIYNRMGPLRFEAAFFSHLENDVAVCCKVTII